VLHHSLAVNSVVPLSGGEGIAHAGRCQRSKAKMGQQAGCSHVPRVGNDKRAVTRVKSAKNLSLLSLRRHWKVTLLPEVSGSRRTFHRPFRQSSFLRGG